VTRYGRVDTTFNHDPAHRQSQHGTFSDFALGTRRARAAILLSLALPGSTYIYQGEELGLWEVEDIPDEVRQDPMFARSGGTNPGRDGCRVPLPWAGEHAPFGFSPDGAVVRPWLPQPAAWRDFTAAVQTGDPDSMLELYRSALHLRRSEPTLGDGPMAWLDAVPDVLALARGPRFSCVVNLARSAVVLPGHTQVLLASGPLDGGLLPTDTAVWLRTG
jgi:alpha-glucosidase